MHILFDSPFIIFISYHTSLLNLENTEFKISGIQTCKYKAIMSSKNVKYEQITDVIQSGQLGTISQTSRSSFPVSGLISILSNLVYISERSILKASIKNIYQDNTEPRRFGPSSGGSLIIVSSNVKFWGTLSVEGGDSQEIYTGAGAGGNIYIYDPLWVYARPKEIIGRKSNWDLRFASGNRKKDGLEDNVQKYIAAENGSLFSSFCPSGSSSVFCNQCPNGNIFQLSRLQNFSK